MTRYEVAEKLLMNGKFKPDTNYFIIYDYLRDLKASHAELHRLIVHLTNDLSSDIPEFAGCLSAALKAAEALR